MIYLKTIHVPQEKVVPLIKIAESEPDRFSGYDRVYGVVHNGMYKEYLIGTERDEEIMALEIHIPRDER